MELSKVHCLMLFTLGSWYSSASKQLEGRPIELAVTKIVFIKALLNAGIAGKTERALYRNLEFLEKKKLVSYDNKVLRLTYRGRKRFEKIVDDVSPYLAVLKILSKSSPLSHTKQMQTRISVDDRDR